jgi:predicted membrane-bound dolichyl-phosphate-mannose-protein mannosyltransferase
MDTETRAIPAVQESAGTAGSEKTGVPDWMVPDPRLVLALLLLASLLCRVVWLTVPNQPIVFDEIYYVNAARLMLGHKPPPNATYASKPVGKDPNLEHPALGKALIAGSMKLFGDRPLGWRLPSIVAGLISILLIYAICVAARGDPWLGLIAATLFAFDNLVLVHSRIAVLDVPMLTFLLLGTWLVFKRRPFLAGAAVGASCLVKITGLYGLLALLLYVIIAGWIGSTERPRSVLSLVRVPGMMLAGFLPVLLIGLWILDLAFTSFRLPWDHLRYIFEYGVTLTRPGGPADSESYPWQWLVNEVQIPYYKVDTDILVNHVVQATRTTVYFRGAMNPIIIGSAPLGVGFALWRWYTARDDLAIWSILWIAATYLPYYPLTILDQRISYIYYFLPTMPAITIALALLLRNGGLPRLVTASYLAMVLVGFVGYFPFRTIL